MTLKKNLPSENFSEYLHVNPDLLEGDIKVCFLSRLSAIKMRMDGCIGKDITKKTGISGSEISRLVTRFMSVDPEGQHFGDRALVPYAHIADYTRSAEYQGKRTQQQGCLSGILGLTLKKYPDVMSVFVSEVLNFHADYAGVKFSYGAMYSRFLKILKSHGVSDSEWPFSESGGGKRTIYNYINEILNSDFIQASQCLGSEGRTHARLGHGDLRLIEEALPFDVLEVDSYYLDGFFIIRCESEDGIYTSRVISRFWLLAVTDRRTKGILAARFVFSSEVRAQDVSELLADAIIGDWQPKTDLTVSGLDYPEGSGMLGYLFPEAKNILCGVLSLDNAMAHHANIIRHKAKEALGFSINYGQLGHPERRSSIENLFNQIARRVMHKIHSTTGSSPSKGRANNPEEKAEKYEIYVDEAEQVLDVWCAAYNITPKTGSLFSKSPAEILSDYYRNRKRCVFPCIHPSVISHLELQSRLRKCMVRGGLKSGVAPYVQLDKARYTNSTLSYAPELCGKSLLIKINPADYRTVQAFLLDGTSVGTLTVLGFWAKTLHSVTTRKLINRAHAARLFEVVVLDDIVESWNQHLKCNPGKRNNLERVRLANEKKSRTQNEHSTPDEKSSAVREEPESTVAASGYEEDPLNSLISEFKTPSGGTRND